MINHLEKLLSLQDIDKLWELHCELMSQYGFDRLIYAFTPFRTGSGLGRLEDTLILSNHDEPYLNEFLRGGLFMHAPMVRWTAENVGACSWSWVEERVRAGLLTPPELHVLDVNHRHGVRAGYSISFIDGSSRARAGIGLCAEPGLRQSDVDEIWERNGRELMVVNAITHLRISTMPFVTAHRALTRRQREVLEWGADGKTTADIAMLMGLTIATVEKHLRLAREALDVETTAQAVLKASLQRQIFFNRSYIDGAIRSSAGNGDNFSFK